jgi:hypothetical protein
VDEVADFTAGNIPGKMFALVNQVWYSFLYFFFFH